MRLTISAAGVSALPLLVTNEPPRHNDENAELRDVPIKASSLNPSLRRWDTAGRTALQDEPPVLVLAGLA
jgi:hypothetical protein